MKRRMIAAVAGLAALTVGAVLALREPAHQAILLTSALATPVGQTPGSLVVSVRIENSGGPDTLLEAYSPSATALLHAPEGAMGLPIPAGSAPVLSADGAHVILSDLPLPSVTGQLIPLTLRFQKAGDITLKATVGTTLDPALGHISGHFGMTDICIPAEGEPEPSIALDVVPDGAGWRITVEADGFAFNDDVATGPHVPGTGHGHLYIDGLKIQRIYSNEVRIGELPPGEHTVTVTLNTNDHRIYVVDDTPVMAETVVTVPAG